MHLDGVQGNREERTEAYRAVRGRSTGAIDAVIRQKLTRCSWLGQLAGVSGA